MMRFLPHVRDLHGVELCDLIINGTETLARYGTDNRSLQDSIDFFVRLK